MSDAPLVILGCGFTGLAAARLALARGRAVHATSRDPARAEQLRAQGLSVVCAPSLTADVVRALLPPRAHVLVTFPPDGSTDALAAVALPDDARCVYVSTTGVYGDRRGHIDARTPTDASTDKARARLDAEAHWRRRGAAVLRAAGIYGPSRGLHLRIARGTFRMTEDGAQVVSRIHVDDLAALCIATLDHGLRDEAHPVADNAPVPQREVIAWLAEQLRVPMPPSISRDEAAESLRHDRSVDCRELQHRLGLALTFPTYREGFAHCLAADGLP